MLEANDKEEEALPSSSTGPSKKRIREDQNDHAIGGMRNPAIAVARLHQVQRVGQQISDAWAVFAGDHPEVLDAAKSYGSREAKIDVERGALRCLALRCLEKQTPRIVGGKAHGRHHTEGAG